MPKLLGSAMYDQYQNAKMLNIALYEEYQNAKNTQ